MADNLFTKNFMLMFLSNFLVCAGFYMLMPIIPAYAIYDLNIDKGSVGLVIGAFSLSAVISRPFLGRLIDRTGRMKVYIPALIIFALCSGGYAMTATVAALFLTRVMHGMSWSGVNTASSTIVSDIVPAGMRGQGMGYFGLSMTIAMALGPALGVFLMDKMSYHMIFIICMLISLTALFASSRVKPPHVNFDRQPFKLSTLYEKRVFGIAFIEFFYGFVYSGVLSFATIHGMELKIEGIGSFFIVFAVFVGIFRPFAGKLMDRRGPGLLVISGLIFFFIGCVVLAVADSLLTFLIAAAFAGLGSGFVMPTIMTMMINVVHPSRRGAANATVFSALDIGIGGGAITMGIVAQFADYFGMYLFSAAVLVIPAAYFLLIELKRYKRMFKEING